MKMKESMCHKCTKGINGYKFPCHIIYYWKKYALLTHYDECRESTSLPRDMHSEGFFEATCRHIETNRLGNQNLVTCRMSEAFSLRSFLQILGQWMVHITSFSSDPVLHLIIFIAVGQGPYHWVVWLLLSLTRIEALRPNDIMA